MIIIAIWEFTSESVTEGHPDKVADRIADAVLDECLRQDKNSRVACEILTTTNLVVVAGEITTKAKYNLEELVKGAIRDIGYTDYLGYNYKKVEIIDRRNMQSQDISQGIKSGEEQGAGDQGMMFGFACNETPEFMPFPIILAHRLTKKMADIRKNRTLPFLRPDGKSQVTIRYDRNKIDGIKSITLASQHIEDVSNEELFYGLYKHVIMEVLNEQVEREVLNKEHLSKLTIDKIIINGTGRFVKGGPDGDTGLTGRKIIADTYGGYSRHGGGAFSGKDPSKVDRSAAYMARYIAKHIVAAGLAQKCEVNFSYTIGKPDSHIFEICTFGTGKVRDKRLKEIAREIFDVRPGMIIKNLDLLRPIYVPTSSYGHFGREYKNGYFPWEKINEYLVKILKSEVKLPKNS